MEYSFYFESKFREWRQVNHLKFQTPDSTEFTMSEEWLTAHQRKKYTPMQRIIFLKENNYDRKYHITVEVSSSVNYTSGKIVIAKVTKPLRTSIIILLTDFKHLNYPVREKTSIEEVVVCERVTKDTFRYKVTISRLHMPQENNEVERIPERDKILILSDQMHSLLETGQLSDVIITDGCTEVRAHRNILSARSVYFECMFQHNWRENQEGIVHIRSTDMKVIKEMLQYIYSGVLRPMDFTTMYDLFEAADMYMLYDLKELLSEELRKRIVVENAVGIFMLGNFASDVNLKFYSLNFISDHFNQVQQTQLWKCLQSEREFWGIIEMINYWNRKINAL